MANFLLFLIISASAFSILTADVSIDCGSSDIYSDDNFIGWVGDENYIKHGESMVVQSTKSVSRAMTTLRVFTDRKKSCYSILNGKGSQVLVRASFFYGNYDKKSSPPTFDLQFDGNHWTTVETSNDEVISYEVIYVTRTDAISVCVAQTTPNMFPFISAFEVRNLAMKMYGHFDSNYALMLRRRAVYGTNETIRFNDDLYDRVWVPTVNRGDFTVLKSDAISLDVTLDDSPPQAVFQNAFATNRTSTAITLGTNLPTTEVPIYMNMYFSEVSVLDSTDKRSFQLFIDGKSSSDPFIPVYAKAGEMFLTNFTASSRTTFSLVATSDSTLPPLINALEVFTVSDQLTDGTNSDDVQGLVALQGGFDVLGDWGGDPCLPAPYSWDWINCTSASIPRLTALNLGSFGLFGLLPDFSSMTALEIIDLHNNSLIGSIPEFLGTLPNLKQLDLADNQLSGSIPSSISKNNKLKLVVIGNPDLCISSESCPTASSGDYPTFSSSRGKKKKSKTPVILGTTIPSFVLLWVIGGVYAMIHQKRKSAAIAAANGAGQAGGANRPNSTPVQVGKMQMAANNIVQNLVNDFRVDIQVDQSAQDQAVDQNDQQNRQDGGY